ncbi:EamA family transporter [Marichromatium gracile]|uniref:EamA-like transporter family protein n=1 Tax=Marichromatium gracile TaxID=1048 RepID=A0ABR5VLK9_MARGR|nr:EamA family transporter [Marichromatium gracile]KXX66215.1 EamA-like transporter family protein [Marichromatium gracile]
MDWVSLSLLCALALASADAATKAWLGALSAAELALVRLTLSGVLLAPLLADLPPLDTLAPAFWGWLAALVPLEIAAMLLYMRAIRDHPLSLTLPYLAFTPVFVLLVAWLLLDETVSARGTFGVVLVVAGAWLLNVGHARARDWRSWLRPLGAILEQRGARLMLAVAAIYALTATLGKGAMQYLPPAQFGAFYFALLGVAALLVLALPSPRRLLALARHPWAVLAVAALTAVMVYTHFLAIAATEVAYMIALKRTSLLFGMLYGALCFGERGLRARLPAGVLMLAGAALVLLG